MPLTKLGETPLYKGTFDCAVKTVKLEGVKGLYKGNVFFSFSVFRK